MVLSLVGDAVGYRNGRWEFRLSTRAIHDELNELTGGKGMAGLVVTRGGEWLVSDDSVFLLATAESLVSSSHSGLGPFLSDLTRRYILAFEDMTGRAPGKTTGRSVRAHKMAGTTMAPFNRNGGGCGGPMGRCAIGLRFPHEEDMADLVKFSVDACRVTHHHPSAYFGAVASALFVSLALRHVPPQIWVAKLLKQAIPIAVSHVLSGDPINVRANKEAIDSAEFVEKFSRYAEERGLSLDPEMATGSPKWPVDFGPEQRDRAFRAWSQRGVNVGSSGYDVVLIAFDAFFFVVSEMASGAAEDRWQELMLRGALHGGDNDTTGAIAAALYGAWFGFEGVSRGNFEQIEYLGRARAAARALAKVALKTD